MRIHCALLPKKNYLSIVSVFVPFDVCGVMDWLLLSRFCFLFQYFWGRLEDAFLFSTLCLLALVFVFGVGWFAREYEY